MTNKRKLNYYHRRFHLVNPWIFLVISVVFLGMAVYGLRQNNFTMIRLREAVFVADKNNKDVEKPLQELRDFVYGHMNTNLSSGANAIKPPIQLQGRYNRLVEANKENIKAENEAVQNRGEAICAQKYPAAGFNAPRVTCVQKYVAENAKTASDDIPAELYKFDFVSPRWSPDLAGISLLFSFLFFVLFVLRLIVGRIYKINSGY